MYLISTYKEPIDLSEDDNSGQQVQLLAKKLVKSPQKKNLFTCNLTTSYAHAKKISKCPNDYAKVEFHLI